MSNFLFVNKYLVVYNVISTLFWSIILFQALRDAVIFFLNHDTDIKPTAYCIYISHRYTDYPHTTLVLVQIFNAIIEISNILLGIVKSSIPTILLQFSAIFDHCWCKLLFFRIQRKFPFSKLYIFIISMVSNRDYQIWFLFGQINQERHSLWLTLTTLFNIFYIVSSRHIQRTVCGLLEFGYCQWILVLLVSNFCISDVHSRICRIVQIYD